METKRRNRIVETLNEKFAFLINNFDMKESYAKIVTWKPYKALSCFVYDWSYTPLKQREVQDSLMTPRKLIKNKAANERKTGQKRDKEDEEFSHKSHRAFIQNLKLAQRTAIKKKKKVEVLWRGYRSFVEPTDNEYTHKELRHRLVVALKEILKIHGLSNLPKNEQKVKNKM